VPTSTGRRGEIIVKIEKKIQELQYLSYNSQWWKFEFLLNSWYTFKRYHQEVYIDSKDDSNPIQTSIIQSISPQRKKKTRMQLKLKTEPEKETVRTDVSRLYSSISQLIMCVSWLYWNISQLIWQNPRTLLSVASTSQLYRKYKSTRLNISRLILLISRHIISSENWTCKNYYWLQRRL